MSSSFWDFLGGVGTGGLGFLAGDASSNSSVWDPFHLFTKSDSQKLAEDQWDWQQGWLNKNFREAQLWKNREFQMARQELLYQHDLNTMQMEREDTAVQRRVADLEAAGLSPTLAAGSAASSTPVHAGNVPHIEPAQHGIADDPRVQAAMFKEGMMKDRMALALTAMGNIADVSRTKAETEFIRAKTGEQDVVNRYVESMLKEKVSGQQISNEAGRIANSFAELSNPVKIDLMRKQLNVLDGHIRQLDLDNELKYNETLRKVYYDSMVKFGAQLAEENVNIAKLRGENIDFDTALKAYSLTYAVEHGIPLHGLNDWQVIYQVVKEFKDLFGKHKKGENPLPKPGGVVPTTEQDWNNYMSDMMTGDYTNPF